MRLRYKSGIGEKTHDFTEEWIYKVVTIGRQQQSTIAIKDTKLSRTHSAVRQIDGFFVLRDMNSRNGTFLNGEKIDFARLKPGDEIQVGDTTLYVED